MCLQEVWYEFRVMAVMEDLISEPSNVVGVSSTGQWNPFCALLQLICQLKHKLYTLLCYICNCIRDRKVENHKLSHLICKFGDALLPPAVYCVELQQFGSKFSFFSCKSADLHSSLFSHTLTNKIYLLYTVFKKTLHSIFHMNPCFLKYVWNFWKCNCSLSNVI